MVPDISGISETAFELHVRQLRDGPGAQQKLTALLSEQHIVYNDKCLAAVNRMRGYIYSSFSYCGTPAIALKYLYEEMESGDNAYTIAAASVAIRHSNARNGETALMLLKGLSRAAQYEGFISFDGYFQNWPSTNSTSAVSEVLKTMAWLCEFVSPHLDELQAWIENPLWPLSKSNSSQIRDVIQTVRGSIQTTESCCAMPVNRGGVLTRTNAAHPRRPVFQKKIRFEDQDGITCSMTALRGRLTLAAFFYTTCENSAKCSLTISNLAIIQKMLADAGLASHVNIVAISYDSFNDKPALLKSYGSARGMNWDGGARMFRVISDFSEVQAYFNLSVNFSGPVVNRHAIELYLLDEWGQIIERFERSQIDLSSVAGRVKEKVIEYRTRQMNSMAKTFHAIKILGIFCLPPLYAVFPKCPFCLAAYLSLFGITGLQLRPFFPYLVWSMPVIVAVNFYALYMMGRKTRNFVPLYFCSSGFLAITLGRYLISTTIINAAGLCLIACGVMFNHFPGILHVVGKWLSRGRRLLWEEFT